jgi:hypothetical protein
MGNFALVTNGIISIVEDIPANTLDEVYTSYRANTLLYVDVTNHEPPVTPGWRYINSELLPPYVPTTEDKLRAIRLTRNTLLANCDWTQLPDVTLTPEKVTEWRVYRQALRDFPSTCDPDNPIWPVPPL